MSAGLTEAVDISVAIACTVLCVWLANLAAVGRVSRVVAVAVATVAVDGTLAAFPVLSAGVGTLAILPASTIAMLLGIATAVVAPALYAMMLIVARQTPRDVGRSKRR